MDNVTDLQAWLAGDAKSGVSSRQPSSFLEGVNKALLKPSKPHASLLDHLEAEIRSLPSPSTRPLIDAAVRPLEEALTLTLTLTLTLALAL